MNIHNYTAKRASEPPGVVSTFLEMFSFHKIVSNLLAKICVLKKLQESSMFIFPQMFFKTANILVELLRKLGTK